MSVMEGRGARQIHALCVKLMPKGRRLDAMGKERRFHWDRVKGRNGPAHGTQPACKKVLYQNN